MSIKGVSNSPLLEKAMAGDQTDVPIGSPVITNTRTANSSSIQDLMSGVALNEPILGQFEEEGSEGLEAHREPSSNSLVFQERTQVNERLVVEWSFNPNSGKLVLVRANKDELEIDGFLRQDSFGHGATGPRGNPGIDGFDGFDGDDGEDGDDGCPGPQGKDGPIGEPGVEGEQGRVGPTGPDGCEGATGDRGAKGPTGRPGFEGPRGRTGPSCSSDSSGGAGAAGLAFGKGVIFGAAAASDPEVAIMGLDDDGLDAEEPAGGWDGVVEQPPTSTPVTPPEEPTTSGRITTCKNFGNIANSCGKTSDAWGTAWANFDAGVADAIGISSLPKANQVRANWTHSFIMCGTLFKGAKYRFELTAPGGVRAALFMNCVMKMATPDAGGTQSNVFVLSEDTSLRVTIRSSSDRIPFWFALKVFDSSNGQLLYATGKNAVNAGMSNTNQDPQGASYKVDINWAVNSLIQYYN